MNYKQFKRIVDKWYPKYIESMCLQHWEIDLSIKKGSPKTPKGDTISDWEYKTAIINLYAHHHKNEKDVLRTLQHELGHCFHAGFVYLMEQINEFLDEKGIKGSDKHLTKTFGLVQEDTAVMVSNIKLKL